MRTLPLALVALFIASPSAARDRRHQVRDLADPTVVSLVSKRTSEGGWLRAMLLVSDRRTSIVIESQTARGAIDQQIEIDRLSINGKTTTMSRVEAVSELAFGPRGLKFSIDTERRSVDCFLVLERDGMPLVREAQCGRNWDVPDRPDPVVPRPPPAPPQWARTPDVIRACGDAFTGQSNEVACLDRVNGFVSDPVAVIRACEAQTTGDANALACLGAVERFSDDATPVVVACEVATVGDANMLRCVTEASRLSYPSREMPAIIAACEVATTGDDNALRCLAATNGVPGGVGRVVELIRACDQAMTGDDAAIACIGRR